MKTNSKFCFIFFAALSISCAPKILFSFSQDLAVVNIGVHMKSQLTQNYLMTISANHLLTDERLQQLRDINIVWSVYETVELKNAELFAKKNAVNSPCKYSFPYNPVEIFMTTASEDGLCETGGIEILKI